METRHHVTLKSGNGKTGPITVTRTTTETCPTSCPLLGQGCYDQGGNGNIHRMKHDAGQYNSCTPAEYFDMIPRFSDVFRHNEGGDLWGAGDKILSDHAAKFLRLCDEAGKMPIVYTHKPVAGVHERGRKRVREANLKALNKARLNSRSTINVSCDHLDEVDRALESGQDVVVVLPHNANDNGRVTLTPEGRKVVHCPATWRNVSCGGGNGKKACGNGSPLCSQKNRGYAVGFPAHGNQQRSISLRILG